MDIRTDIDNICKEGEGLHIEFKSWINAKNMKERINLASDELVAFSNAEGGTVYFGIEDSGEVTGCDNYDMQNLIEAIYDKTRPPLFVKALEIPYDDMIIIALHVESDGLLHALSDGRFLKRLGKNSKPYYPEDRNTTFDANQRKDFSSRVVKGSTIDDINLLEVYSLKQKLKARDSVSTLADLDDLAFLRDLKLIRDDNGQERLTVAGMLFVGKEKSIEQFLPQAEVIYLHYSAENPVEYDARLDLKQPLITVLDRLSDRVQDFDRIVNLQVGLFRLEIHSYAQAVFQEALLNALSHRDYEKMGSIYVKHYPDKIVIENPGGFLDGINKDNIITHPSAPRNKLIAETLQSLKYVQRSGQGVDIIFREMISMGKPYPEYNDFSDAVTLIICSAVENISFVEFIAREQDRRNKMFSLSELMILRYLTDNKRVMMKDIVKLTQTPRDAAVKACTELINAGLIEFSGKSYILTERAYIGLKSDVEYARDKTVTYIKAKNRIVDYIESNGSISNQIAQELCGFTRQQVRTTFEKMIRDDVIVMVGSGKSTRYVLK